MSIFIAGLKFSLVGGKLATASSLLLLLADHLGVVAEVFKEVCALWMVSDLLGTLKLLLSYNCILSLTDSFPFRF